MINDTKCASTQMNEKKKIYKKKCISDCKKYWLIYRLIDTKTILKFTKVQERKKKIFIKNKHLQSQKFTIAILFYICMWTKPLCLPIGGGNTFVFFCWCDNGSKEWFDGGLLLRLTGGTRDGGNSCWPCCSMTAPLNILP